MRGENISISISILQLLIRRWKEEEEEEGKEERNVYIYLIKPDDWCEHLILLILESKAKLYREKKSFIIIIAVSLLTLLCPEYPM